MDSLDVPQQHFLIDNLIGRKDSNYVNAHESRNTEFLNKYDLEKNTQDLSLKDLAIFLKSGLDINSVDKTGRRLLSQCLAEGHHEGWTKAELLVCMGANVSFLDREMFLNSVAKQKNITRNQLAHELNLNPHFLDDLGLTLLYLSLEDVYFQRRSRRQTKRMESQFREANTNRLDWKKPQLSLHSVVIRGDIDMLKIQLNVRENVDCRDEFGRTPLHAIVRKKQSLADLTMIELLLSYGASINSLDNNERNVLHMAAEEQKYGLLEYFLERGGININAADLDGKTPLHILVQNFDETMALLVDKLLYYGADISIVDNKDTSVLHLAALRHIPVLVKYFIDRGLNVNGVDRDGNTALHFAVKRDYLFENKTQSFASEDSFNLEKAVEVIKILLREGADKSIKNHEGIKALHLWIW